MKTTVEYPILCQTHARPYRYVRYLSHVNADEIRFIHERIYKSEKLPLSLRIANTFLGGFIKNKVKAWESENTKALNSWYAIKMCSIQNRYEFLGPFNSKIDSKKSNMPVIVTGDLEIEIQTSHSPWTPYSDMVDGPEDYCALSLTLAFKHCPHPDFDETKFRTEFDLLEDLASPGPRYFGNTLHKDDPKVVFRIELIQRFFNKNDKLIHFENRI